MRGEQKVMLRTEPERTARPSRSRGGGSKPAVEMPAEVAPVFERLRAWRAATAKEQGVPAYVIFHDATLREIATRSPPTGPRSARSPGSARASSPATATR